MTAASSDLPPRIQRCISPATRYWQHQGAFQLESGAQLDDVVVAYQTWGKPDGGGRTILVCHALTGSADVDGWWPGLIGKTFDPQQDFVICSNLLGSCYGTTGPLSRTRNGDGRFGPNFPLPGIRDFVELQRRLLDALGVGYIDIAIGPSLGGMQVLEWALMYPHRVGAIVPIGVGPEHSAWCIGISEAQRAAIRADPHWSDGNYDERARPAAGLAAARMMAMCTYRSPAGFAARFGRGQSGTENGNEVDGFDIQSYLRYQGDKFVSRFDANCYMTLSRAMHSHNIARGRGDLAAVLAGIRQRALVVSINSDVLYPPSEQKRLVDGMPNATHRTINSDHGHDGFLIEIEQLAALLEEFLPAADANDRWPQVQPA